MTIPIYWFDSFTGRRFGGNPAAVCVLDTWPDDTVLQQVAAENNLSETAFITPETNGYRIRWFTPEAEVPLCGHATLAAAAVVFGDLAPETSEVAFSSMSGPLSVARDGAVLTLDFPTAVIESVPAPAGLVEGLGAEPREVWRADYYMAVFDTQDRIVGLTPDMTLLAGLDRIGVIVTAPGEDADFVSRFFAPQVGIPEDPVTGSAHCMLTPYWAKRLGKTELTARQLSKRGGELRCRHSGERVHISGTAVRYLEGVIHV